MVINMAGIHSNITFGLVNIPIVMTPIIRNNDTSFNQLHKKCLNRVYYIKYCPICKKNLKGNEIIKGYNYQKDDYLIFDKKELDVLKPENDHEIEVISFININEIPLEYLEKSYFLTTDKKSKAYNLFYEVLKKSKMVALAKCVISSKFYYCILRFTKEGIIMTTLYFEEEVDIPDTEVNNKIGDKELKLGLQLVNSMKGTFEPNKYKDEYQDNIKKAISKKLSGKKITGPKKTNKVQINNLLEALEKSLK